MCSDPFPSDCRMAGLLNLDRPGKLKRINDFFPVIAGTKKKGRNEPKPAVYETQQPKNSTRVGNKTTNRAPIHHKEKQQQLYLDFGQNSFAKQILCADCGMLFVHGVEDDYKSHKMICKEYKQGVSFGRWTKERVIRKIYSSSGAMERIVEVRYQILMKLCLSFL